MIEKIRHILFISDPLNSNFFLRFTIKVLVPFFIVTNLLICIFAPFNLQKDFLQLSLYIASPFLLGLLLVSFFNAPVLFYFSLISFFSAWLAPLGFFYEKDKFVFGGFSAIKFFTFIPETLINSYYSILIPYYFALVIGILGVRKHKVIQKKTTFFFQSSNSHS